MKWTARLVDSLICCGQCWLLLINPFVIAALFTGEDGSCGANGAFCNGDVGGGGGSLSAGEDGSLSPEPPSSTFNGHPKRTGPSTFTRVHITKNRQQQHNGNSSATNRHQHHHHYNHHQQHHHQPLVTTERKIFDEGQ